MRLTELTRADSDASAFEASPRNIEIACGYAIRTANKWKKRIPYWMDDVAFEEAVIAAVMRAAARYDPDNATGASFFTYCHSMVYGACLEEDRFQRRHKPPDQLDALKVVGMINDAPMTPLSVADMIADERELPEDTVVLNETVHYLMTELGPKVLSERELEVIRLRYLESMKQKDIAEIIGVTAGRIHQIEEIALRKLREAASTLQ